MAWGRSELVAGIHSYSSLVKDQPLTHGVGANRRQSVPDLNCSTAAGAATEPAPARETDGLGPEKRDALRVRGILVLQREGQLRLELLYAYTSDQNNKGFKRLHNQKRFS